MTSRLPPSSTRYTKHAWTELAFESSRTTAPRTSSSSSDDATVEMISDRTRDSLVGGAAISAAYDVPTGGATWRPRLPTPRRLRGAAALVMDV
jgi:hypothetical protein